MQVKQVVTKVQLTNSELIKTVLANFSKQELVSAIRKQYPELPESFEFEVIEDLQEEEVKALQLDNEGWIDVPEDWIFWYCPTKYEDDTIIEVVFRDGTFVEVRHNAYKRCWYQSGTSTDIVKYRAKP